MRFRVTHWPLVFFTQTVLHEDSFETEAEGNSEIAILSGVLDLRNKKNPSFVARILSCNAK